MNSTNTLTKKDGPAETLVRHLSSHRDKIYWISMGAIYAACVLSHFGLPNWSLALAWLAGFAGLIAYLASFLRLPNTDSATNR